MKQNLPRILRKQGTFYELNLKKNQGPFLSKDIMHDNPKSISLLTGDQTLSSHQSMVNTLKIFEKDPNIIPVKSIKKTFHAQNFYSQMKYIEGQLGVVIRGFQNLKSQQKKIRKEMQVLNDLITKESSDLLEQSIPVLKNLMRKVKQYAYHSNAEVYKMSREIKQISKNSDTINQILVQCSSTIEYIQKSIGQQKINPNLTLQEVKK